jgi:hypothetical protein
MPNGGGRTESAYQVGRDAGKWKVVKTHRLSEKEAKERQKEL